MIDPAKLPKVAMLDTGVLVRALGDRPDHPDSLACKELFDAMVVHKREILIAAPTLAEYLRFGKVEPPPSFDRIAVVAFDDRCAAFLGERFPEARLHEWGHETGAPIAYFKYDAMIVACARIHRADCLVVLDGKKQDGSHRGLFSLAEHGGVVARHPADFQQPQRSLFEGMPPTTTGVDAPVDP